MATKVIAKFVRFDTDDKKLVINYEEKFYRISMLPFQTEENIPSELQCLLTHTSGNPGTIFLQLDYETYIREKFSEGDEADFRIVATRSHYYEVKDVRYGLRTNIAKSRSINPALSTIIHCRITRIWGKNVSIALVGKATEQSLDVNRLQRMLMPRFTAFEGMERLAELISNETIGDLFSDECRQWVNSITEGKDSDERQQLIRQVKDTCYEALCAPDFLTQCQMSERGLLERRLAFIIEHASYYIHSYDLLKGGQATQVVEDFLQVLYHSGYHYHPRKWFSIVLNIFLQDFELMRQYMPRVIEVIRAHRMEVWKRQPTDSLWIGMLETFIVKANRMIYRSTSNPELVDLLINALILQLTLNEGKEYSQIDDDLNRAILFRLVARQNVNNPTHMLCLAFGQVTGVAVELPSLPATGLDTVQLSNMISNDLNSTTITHGPAMEYVSDTAMIRIQDGTITASRTDGSDEGRSLLSDLGLQFGLDVVLDGSLPHDLKALHGVNYYKRLWKHIQQSIFAPAKREEKTRVKPLEGAEVYIVVTGIIDPLHFRCRIVDEDLQGSGTLDIEKDFAPYTYDLDYDDFFSEEGYPLVMEATVLEINEDDSIRFSMADQLMHFFDNFRQEHINYNTRIYCSLNSRTMRSRFPGVSTDGLPMSVDVSGAPDADQLEKGMVVETEGCQRLLNNKMFNTTYVQQRPDITFVGREVVHRMLIAYAAGEYRVESQSQQRLEAMEYSHVNEIMHQLETFAWYESDSTRSYNYLAFCRLMAYMLGNDNSVEFYNRRLTLLEMLADFEVNNKVQDENMELLSGGLSSFSDNALLRRDFMRMSIISWLGREGYDDQLHQAITTATDPQLRQLAQLVQAFNFVDQAHLATQAEAIRDHIRSLLKLKASTTNKHYYGQEDDLTEFKTSIVFTADSKPNLKLQTSRIMREICAFLNARGGCLLLGVNDAGYEAGLDDDMKYADFRGGRDPYKHYVENQVAVLLGQEAASHVQAHWDEGVNSDVLVIDISPCPNPVELAGQYYERMGTSARQVNDEYRPVFLRTRRKWAEATFPELYDESRPLPAAAPAKPESKATTTPSRPQVDEDMKIPTSRFRNNVLHDYDEGYEYVTNYIYIADNAKYKISQSEWEEADHLLTLAVHEDEVQGYLVLVYANGAVAKVKLAELLERQPDTLLPRYAEQPLIYASIATDDHSVVVGFADDTQNQTRFVRVDDLPYVPTCSIQQGGTLLTDVGFSSVFFAHTAPTHMLQGVNRNQKRTFLGSGINNTFGRQILEALHVTDF